MNWITKKISELKASAKRVIKKMPTFQEVQAGIWISTCCGPVLKSDLRKNFFQCPKCNKNQRILKAQDRFDVFFGENNYEILDIKIDKSWDDPLRWFDNKSYIERLKQARKKIGANCAVQFAVGKLKNGIQVTCGAISFSFIGGSIGIHEGNTILAGIDLAIQNRTPLVFFACGGGQRMYESPYSLQQMVRTSLKVTEFKNSGQPYISFLVDPCYGGITASFVWGDFVFSEKDALIGFAGQEIIKTQTPGEVIEDSFQKSGSLLKHGFLDAIFERKDLNENTGNLLSILTKKNALKNVDEESSENKESVKKAASAS